MICVAHALSCAIPPVENWTKSSFFSDTFLCRRPNVISAASSESVEPLTTASALNRKPGCSGSARDGDFSSTWIIAKTSSSERTASWCRRGEVLHDLALLARIVAHFASDKARQEGDNDVCGLSL